MFGIGEIIGVITNPSEVLRNLTESKKLLEEARQEMNEQRERSQIPASHTFSPLPGFYQRPNELEALERALGAVPALTILMGSSSTGKTALCRQVLSQDRFHCIHFDLRLAGFADLPSLYFSLAQQMESYFACLPEMMGVEWGWDAFEKESWAFKHDRLAIEKRLQDGAGEIRTADIAHLLELFQSALLKYWQFEPMSAGDRAQLEAEKQAIKDGKLTKEEAAEARDKKLRERRAKRPRVRDETEAKMRDGAVPSPSKENEVDLLAQRTLQKEDVEGDEKKQTGDKASQQGKEEEEEVEEPVPPPKKVPVVFLDEAHKLPALIRSDDTMKAILDAFLVLTKQDRLAHVIHATSDSFYLHWLRLMNVSQHAILLSIGDTSKDEARAYFTDVLLPHVPEKLRTGIEFEELYRVFGGKLAHLADYTSEYINSQGETDPWHSSHYLQAHSLLNLQLIHSMPPREGETPGPGFAIYSSLAHVSPHAAPSPSFSGVNGGGTVESASAPALAPAPAEDTTSAPTPQTPAPSQSDFKASDLLLVMSRLSADRDDPVPFLPYFPLCRELGAKAVDGMVRGRLLELRWTKTITPEGDFASVEKRREVDDKRGKGRVVGPVLVPTTPVVRRAMEGVLKEYEEEMEEIRVREKGKREGARGGRGEDESDQSR